MKALLATYSNRVHNGFAHMRNSMVGLAFVPFVVVTAALGCWKNPTQSSTWKLGDVFVSSLLSILVGYIAYFAFGFSMTTLLLDMYFGK